MQSLEAYTLPPDKLLQAIAYAHVRHAIYFSSVAVSAAVLLGLIYFRTAPRLRRRGGLTVITALFLITAAFDLPAAIWSHAASLHYGISVQRWPGWFLDWLEEQALALPVTIVVVLGFCFLVRRSPARWWIYAWASCIPLTIFVAWVEPFALEPLFNHFEPLASAHPELIEPIERILARAAVSIPRDRLFEMRASTKTNSLNAYVSGFGSSRRLVLYDTIIRKEPGPELMTTFGHELGHYALGHIPKSILFGTALLFFGFFVTYKLAPAAIARWGARFDIRGPEDWASLPVFALILLTLSFLTEPAVNAYSRNQEHAADVFSLEVTDGIVPDNTRAAAHAFQIEGETDLDPPHPSPFIVFWLYTHPPTAERFRFALNWRPALPARSQ